MFNKLLLVAATALPLTIGTTGAASAKGLLDNFDIGAFSANISVITDYAFRGLSQTNEAAAVQGGIDWERGLIGEDGLLGVYLGVWGSNVNFVGMTESAEIDLYGGFAGEFMNFSYDIGLLYYYYPGATDDLELDFLETYGSLGYDFGFAQVTGAINYSSDFFLDSGEAIYYQADISVPLPFGVTAGALVGYQNIEENDFFGLPDYLTWGASADLDLGTIHSRLGGMAVGVSYTDTNIDDFQCGGGQICDARFMLGVSAEIGVGEES